eukprot:4993101-Pleurochrysis_carterae.AAC.1
MLQVGARKYLPNFIDVTADAGSEREAIPTGGLDGKRCNYGRRAGFVQGLICGYCTPWILWCVLFIQWDMGGALPPWQDIGFIGLGDIFPKYWTLWILSHL